MGLLNPKIFGSLIQIAFRSLHCAAVTLCNSLKYYVSVIPPKIGGLKMFSALKVSFLIKALSKRHQCIDLKEWHLEIEANLSIVV